MDTITVPNPRRWRILGVLCVALFAIVMDNTIVNVALPTLARELHADTSRLQWIVDAYTLVFAGLLLAAGGLGDRFGRKPALIARPGRVRVVLRGGRARLELRPADRRARVHGRRRGADLPDNAGDRGERLHRRPRARRRDRDLDRGHRRRRGARAYLRWLAPRALLVGIGVPGERADRDRGGCRCDLAGAELARPARTEAGPRRGSGCRSLASRCSYGR